VLQTFCLKLLYHKIRISKRKEAKKDLLCESEPYWAYFLFVPDTLENISLFYI